MSRRQLVAVLAAACALPVSFSVCAEKAWPQKPIKLIVPYPAGAVSDFLGRQAANVMSQELGQPVVVENKPGAGTNIGSENVAKAAPDGYTLLLASTTNSVNMTLFPKMTYDTLKDLAPVSILANVPNWLVVNTNFPAKNVSELIAYAKQKPGEVAYASAGPGSPAHLAAEQFNRMAGVKLRNIAYKGASPAITDVMAGHVPVMFTNYAAVRGAVDAGRVRVLATGGATRWPSMPNVPTVAESGVAGYEAGAWYGLMAPAGTPPEIIAKINRALAGLRSPAMEESFLKQGAELVLSTPDEMKQKIQAEIPYFAKLIKDAGITIE